MLIVGKTPTGALYTGSTLGEHFDSIMTVGSNLWLKDGYIVPFNNVNYPNGWQFNLNRDYLLPIRQEMVGGLTDGMWEQNPGW